MKNRIIAIVVVCIAFSVMDFVVHGLWLAATYGATAELWRPMEDMSNLLMFTVTFFISAAFVLGYAKLVSPKSINAGLTYGLIVGLIVGLGFGFGSYGYLPIPLSLAVSWFASAVVEFTVVGCITGYIIND